MTDGTKNQLGFVNDLSSKQMRVGPESNLNIVRLHAEKALCVIGAWSLSQGNDRSHSK